MNEAFKKFIYKLLLFGSPIIALVVCYFVMDPFHVLYKYDNYGSNFLKTYNRNKISTDVFLANNPTYNFKSFIFGSSRSSAFITQEWANFVNDPHPYHFDSFNDNISGMEGKMSFIIKQGNAIKNALLVIDNDTFNEDFDTTESIVHLKDYRWDTKKNAVNYQLTFFKAFFKKQYFISFFDLKLNKEFKPYMEEFFKFKYFYTPKSNDFLFPENIEAIKKDSLKYYKTDAFKNRKENPPMEGHNIRPHHIPYLAKISAILKAQNTNYKIIISPIFDRREYNPVDIEILKVYFGEKNIYNYSGKNKITNEISNYYEASHFKPSVGKTILEEIYK